MRITPTLLAAAISSLLLPTALRAQADAPPTRVTVPLDGDRAEAGLFAERIRFPAGDRGRVHTHSGDLHVVGIRGRLFYNFGTRFDTTGARVLAPGDFLILPAGRAHFEWTEEPAEVHVQGVGPVTTEFVEGSPKPGR